MRDRDTESTTADKIVASIDFPPTEPSVSVTAWILTSGLTSLLISSLLLAHHDKLQHRNRRLSTAAAANNNALDASKCDKHNNVFT